MEGSWTHGDWNTNVTLLFPIEDTYYLEWYAEDNLGNTEEIHTQTHYVVTQLPP
jgi:hypothetical protein